MLGVGGEGELGCLAGGSGGLFGEGVVEVGGVGEVGLLDGFVPVLFDSVSVFLF